MENALKAVVHYAAKCATSWASLDGRAAAILRNITVALTSASSMNLPCSHVGSMVGAGCRLTFGVLEKPQR